MLGDVGNLQLIGHRPGELAVHQIPCRGGLMAGTGSAATGQALDPGPAHQHLHGTVPDGDAQAQSQLGMHPPGPIDAAGGQMNRLDLVCQPRMADRPHRGRPAVSLVIAGLRDPEHPSTRVASCTGRPSPAITVIAS
jgi:hypothetical protein